MRAAVFLCLLVGCTADEPSVIRVAAATSLIDVMPELETAYEKKNGGRDVVTQFAGSQILRVQIEHGANVDVFVSANERHAHALVEKQLASNPTIVARNRIALIVPPTSGRKLFEEIVDARTLIGTTSSPIGEYSERVLANAGVALQNVVSREPNVRSIRAKIERGEADAGFVYESDVNDKVKKLPFSNEFNVSTKVVAAPIRSTKRGIEFVEFLASEDAAKIFEKHRFSPR